MFCAPKANIQYEHLFLPFIKLSYSFNYFNFTLKSWRRTEQYLGYSTSVGPHGRPQRHFWKPFYCWLCTLHPGCLLVITNSLSGLRVLIPFSKTASSLFRCLKHKVDRVFYVSPCASRHCRPFAWHSGCQTQTISFLRCMKEKKKSPSIKLNLWRSSA